MEAAAFGVQAPLVELLRRRNQCGPLEKGLGRRSGGDADADGLAHNSTYAAAGFSGGCPLPSALIYAAVFLDRFSGSQCVCVDTVKLLLQVSM